MKTLFVGKRLLVGSIASLLGIASVASADRGYGSRGGDRYDNQRVQASVRYGQGSRNYDQTYGRYGQANYGLRTDYDRDYNRRYSAGPRYYSGRPGNVGFSLGFGSGSYGDGVSFGLNYNSGSRYYDRGYYGSRYYGRPLIYAPPVYYAPAPVYYAPPPVYYAPPVVYDAPYYSRSYYDNGGSSYYYESRSYYGR